MIASYKSPSHKSTQEAVKKVIGEFREDNKYTTIYYHIIIVMRFSI